MVSCFYIKKKLATGWMFLSLASSVCNIVTIDINNQTVVVLLLTPPAPCCNGIGSFPWEEETLASWKSVKSLEIERSWSKKWSLVRDRVEKQVNVLLLILLMFITVVFWGKPEDREWLPDEVKKFIIGSHEFRQS